MTLRKIAEIGHPVLREEARLVEQEELLRGPTQRLIDDMIDTMRDANGAGIAANQVFEPVQICILEVKDNPRYPYKPTIPLTVLVNPVLTPIGEDLFENYEGCLSVPNLRGLVHRHRNIRVEALDRHGNAIDCQVRGLTAGTYQHEVDHLRGKLFVDRVHDPKTLGTIVQFERHHRGPWLERIADLIAR